MCGGFFLLTAYLNIRARNFDQFTYLAQSFLQGQLHFLTPGHVAKDAVKINGHYYWHLGPFPSILLMPFVFLADLIQRVFHQGYLQFFLTGGIFAFCFRIARRTGFSDTDALYLAFAFCFASVYQLTAFVSWGCFFQHAVTVFFLLAAISEFYSRKRHWLIGLCLAAVFATRFNAGFCVVFFIGAILWDDSRKGSEKIRSLMALLAPLIICGLGLLLYNYLRFGTVWENGYRMVGNHTALDYFKDERSLIHNYGIFQIRNIPTNFYYYFLKTLDPVLKTDLPWTQTNYVPAYILQPPYLKAGYPGAGFFVVAPVFLYAFRTNLREKAAVLSLLAILPVLLSVLSYYWNGWFQIGPRYTQDFLPFAYLALMFSFPGFKLSPGAKSLIIASALFDLFLFHATWKTIGPVL